MKWPIGLILFLISAFGDATKNRFFISAPNVFHIGVKEKVFVQVGPNYFNKEITLYLETQQGTIVSDKVPTNCSNESDVKTVDLMIKKSDWLGALKAFGKTHQHHYLNLKVEGFDIRDGSRPTTRVLVSPHRGYIFIQTNQPMYNPKGKVMYRIFTLDHMFRPHEEPIYISIYNADGNRVQKGIKKSAGGIYQSSFLIPDVSKLGTWKITAHYEDDEMQAAVREFKVQKFDLPSFDVTIAMDQHYILLNDNNLNLVISAMYSYGKAVEGAYHCQFGVVEKSTADGGKATPTIIRKLEKAGSMQEGNARVSFQLEDINLKLKERLNITLSDLQKQGSQIFFSVFVTNIKSGEMQEAEVSFPIISQKYTLDFSRTHSHFVPGFPFDVVLMIRHPDGSPASDVAVNINVQESEESCEDTTNQDGSVSCTFNVGDVSQITVDASADGLQKRKTVKPSESPSGSYLHMAITNKVYSVNEMLYVTFSSKKGPSQGYIHYIVTSRGIIINKGSLVGGTSVKLSLQITADMIPDFRLIGYFHTDGGDIVADSVWVDVKDECPIQVKVKQTGSSEPGKKSELEIDLLTKKAKVALLAVDKAFYGLNVDNKLTGNQVFEAMNSYDLGCSFGGGKDQQSILWDAGLAFVDQKSEKLTNTFGCSSDKKRKSRSVDLQKELNTLISESNYTDSEQQECCSHAFLAIPMRRSCKERASRVLLIKNKTCADVFLNCCYEAERLRRKMMLEEGQTGFGRTATVADIKQFFLDPTGQYIRRSFSPSFEFTEFDVNDKKRHSLVLPDSITTWEIQLAVLSSQSGFCVVKPIEIKAFKNTFVSLRLPYSVKKFEQLAISPVIYNYGDTKLEVAVHLEQVEGLCSPASATASSYLRIALEPHSSQLVSFSVVPIKAGKIPIQIRLYDVEDESGVDAVEKKLTVLTEGVEERVETTKLIKLDGTSTKTLSIDGSLPFNTVPEADSNMFVSMEVNGFGNTYAKNLLSPEKVSKLIDLPSGCVEQTMSNLAPTTLAVRYLDLSDQWFDLPPGERDRALHYLDRGYLSIHNNVKYSNGAFASWSSAGVSNWLTALVVKVLSFIEERRTATFGQQGRHFEYVPTELLELSANYLLSKQNSDGSFPDQNPVLHNGLMSGIDRTVSITAFTALALNRSHQFLKQESQPKMKASIIKATTYINSQFAVLQHPYAVATAAYCLSVCLEGDSSFAWEKLQSMATKEAIQLDLVGYRREAGFTLNTSRVCCKTTSRYCTANNSQKYTLNDCYMWTNNRDAQREAIRIETTAYALLTAVAQDDRKWADQIACWLASRENYHGGYKSSQDTLMALEALSEYELKRYTSPSENVIAEFTVVGKNDILKIEVDKQNQRVEKDLKKFVGHNVKVNMKGQGEFKFKTVKAYYLLDSMKNCDKLSINVSVEGEVKVTAEITDDYNYDEDYGNTGVPENKEVPENTITYSVCVSVSPNYTLTGMAIVDITLLSAFNAVEKDLEALKTAPELYISHYELSYGRVLIYLNKLFEEEECFNFKAKQDVSVSLLQPAPAVFYDYYEPERKCTVFYAAPKSSKLISTLCSEDVCQCAERPCHGFKETFKQPRGKEFSKEKRLEYTCFYPVVHYAYIVTVNNVTVKSNFELYKVTIDDVLRYEGDEDVKKNSIRVFAKRLHCKGKLDLGEQYLIMGKDGSTKDSNGAMQFLLESNTWVESVPLGQECKKSANAAACNGFFTFVDEYKINGCRQ